MYEDAKLLGTGLQTLLATPQEGTARALAARYAPIIYFDAREPFLPLAAGYTLFRADARSPSFPRAVELHSPGRQPTALAIEYAVWWDWDIGHLYELEHVWVFVDERGRPVRVEGSWHGGFHDIAVDGQLLLEGEHPVVYSEPGKHAFASRPDRFESRRRQHGADLSQRLAGSGGLWITPLFQEQLAPLRTPHANTLVRTYLQRHAFEPAWEFPRRFAITPEMLVPWPAMQRWIPDRMAGWIDVLTSDTPPEELVFLRIGHRGASAHSPENTLASFRKAAELGAHMVELDVQVSADGTPVVIHDLDVGRRTTGQGAVSDLTLDQLKALDVGNGQHIPTLEEAITCCLAEQLGMYIELKAGAAIEPVVDAVQRLRLHRWVIVGSFRPDWLAGVKLLDPAVETSVLFGAPNVDPVKLAQAVNADYVHPCWESLGPQPHRLLTRDWIQRARQAGLGIILWHEERPDEIAALKRLGVDGICSDAPDLLR